MNKRKIGSIMLMILVAVICCVGLGITFYTCHNAVQKEFEELEKKINNKECIDGTVWEKSYDAKFKYQVLENGNPIKCIKD